MLLDIVEVTLFPLHYLFLRDYFYRNTKTRLGEPKLQSGSLDRMKRKEQIWLGGF